MIAMSQKELRRDAKLHTQQLNNPGFHPLHEEDAPVCHGFGAIFWCVLPVFDHILCVGELPRIFDMVSFQLYNLDFGLRENII